MEIKDNLNQHDTKLNAENLNSNMVQNDNVIQNQISEIISDVKNLKIENNNNESHFISEINTSFQDIKWLTGC